MNPIFEAVIVPQTRDLGDGFQVRRVLPSEQRRTVGPFVFFDQMGPTVLPAGTGLDVRPHPHIGLATVTYLFDGEILHRDSLGTVQRSGRVRSIG
jgi:redox-sensitive bicupin YhaK (pirin superfamily)